MSKKGTFEVWAYLAANYPEHAKQYEDKAQYMAAYELFHDILKDIDDDVLKAAAKQHVATEKWFPKICEIRRIALDLTAPQVESADDAWATVIRQIRIHGIYESPKFDNQRTANVVRVLGWLNLCNSEYPDLMRRDFVRIYNDFSERDRENRMLLPESKEVIRLASGIGDRKQLRAV